MNTSQAQTLGELLQIEIASKGPIPFREFMAHALYHPDWGYYSSGHAAIGRAGDFYTSVSVGPLFGALIARQVSEMWRLMGQPTEFNFVEQGAHRGDFAHDLLHSLQSQDPSCLSALRYTIVEPCTRQSGHQQQMLAEFSHVPMRWLERMEDLQVFVGIHFSNELLDAFPVHRLVWNQQQWEEQYVACEDGAHQSIRMNGKVPEVIDEKCVGCNLCMLVCPVPGCITMETVETGRSPMSWRGYQEALGKGIACELPGERHSH